MENPAQRKGRRGRRRRGTDEVNDAIAGMNQDSSVYVVVGKCKVFNCRNTYERISDQTRTLLQPGEVVESVPLCEEHYQRFNQKQPDDVSSRSVSGTTRDDMENIVQPNVDTNEPITPVPRKRRRRRRLTLNAKRCFMQNCQNTTDNSNKMFFEVPANRIRRYKWLRIAGRRNNSKNIYCCIDHFAYPEDFEPGSDRKVLLKKVLPKPIFNSYPELPYDVDEQLSRCGEHAYARKEYSMASMMPSIAFIKVEPEDIVTADSEITIKLEPTERVEEESIVLFDDDDDMQMVDIKIEEDFDELDDLLDCPPTQITDNVGHLHTHMNAHSKHYVGLHPHRLDKLLPILLQHTRLDQFDLWLTLRWLRLRESFLVLSYTFKTADVRARVERSLPRVARFFRDAMFRKPFTATDDSPDRSVLTICSMPYARPHPVGVLLVLRADGQRIRFVSSALAMPLARDDLLAQTGLLQRWQRSGGAELSVNLMGCELDTDEMAADLRAGHGVSVDRLGDAFDGRRRRNDVLEDLRAFGCLAVNVQRSYADDNGGDFAQSVEDEAYVMAAALFNVECMTDREMDAFVAICQVL